MSKKLIAGLTGVALLGVAPLAFAQSVIPTTTSTYTTTGATTSTTGTTGTSGTTTTTPGVPNTGAGGDAAANIALLVTSGLLALGGAAYVARIRSVRA